MARYLYWIIPPLFCLALYWHGLKAWFQMDDFAWLSLHTRVHDFPSLISALFSPMAQGTVRPLSERLFFLGFWHLFGMEALPYRALVFGTQFVNLILLSLLTRRLTGSVAAGFFAPLLWLASPVLYEPMVWTSAYNQILCAFFFLLNTCLLLRYLDTDDRRYYAALWISFLLGFGALELNVVFPAIALLYVALFARPYVVRIAPMLLVSAAYTVWHRSAGHSLQNVVYAMDWSPLSLLKVFGRYVWLSVSAVELPPLSGLTKLQISNAAFVVVLALVVFSVMMALKRRWLVLFFLGWFAIALGPYLPLSNHISDYYLTVPTIGLAMLGAWALAAAWQVGSLTKLTAAIVLVLFAVPCGWQAWALTRKWSQESRRVRHFVRGLATAHKRHPNKMIILKGVDNDLFWSGVFDRPQRALGWTGVYMTADTQRTLVPSPEQGSIGDRCLPDAVTLDAIANNQAVVYDVSQFPLRNITAAYARVLSFDSQIAFPHFFDAGMSGFAKFQKDGWFAPASGGRWTAKRATVEMRGPVAAGGQITYHAFLVPQHTTQGRLTVSLSIDGRQIGSSTAAVGASDINPTYNLPADLAGKPSMLVSIEVDRTIVAPPDERRLGLLFGTIEVTP